MEHDSSLLGAQSPTGANVSGAKLSAQELERELAELNVQLKSHSAKLVLLQKQHAQSKEDLTQQQQLEIGGQSQPPKELQPRHQEERRQQKLQQKQENQQRQQEFESLLKQRSELRGLLKQLQPQPQLQQPQAQNNQQQQKKQQQQQQNKPQHPEVQPQPQNKQKQLEQQQQQQKLLKKQLKQQRHQQLLKQQQQQKQMRLQQKQQQQHNKPQQPEAEPQQPQPQQQSKQKQLELQQQQQKLLKKQLKQQRHQQLLKQQQQQKQMRLQQKQQQKQQQQQNTQKQNGEKTSNVKTVAPLLRDGDIEGMRHSAQLQCRGHARFAAGGKGGVGWTSHMGQIVFKLSVVVPLGESFDVDSHAQLIMIAVKHTFGQRPKGGGPYIKPFFKESEMERMKSNVVQRFATRVAAKKREIPEEDGDEMVHPISDDEFAEAIKHHEARLCEACEEGKPCTRVIEVLEGQYYRIVSLKKYGQRRKRLNRCRRRCENGDVVPDGCMRLYHQTDPEAAKAILASQLMRRGQGGLYGAGIYFARTSTATERKALHKGVILECIVFVGRIKDVNTVTRDQTFGTLVGEGYDSLCGHNHPGVSSLDEIVVYNSDQVLHIREYQAAQR